MNLPGIPPAPSCIRVAARGSRLSRAQTDEAVRVIRTVLPPDTRFEIAYRDTPGDRDKRTPLADPSVPDDFFTRDLDRAVLARDCTLAVHSAKDLPRRLPDGLAVAAILPCLDPADALVLRAGVAAPADVRIAGTSTPRRDAAIRALAPRAELRPLRGTIDERLAALDRGDFDAIVVAACALRRLGLADRVAARLPGDTAPLQGHLALIVRADDDALVAALRVLDFRRALFDAADAAPPVPPGPVPPDATLFLGTHPEHFPHLAPLVSWPMIRLEPRPLAERAARMRELLDGCSSIAFASAFAARAFAHALLHTLDARAVAGHVRLAVGPATADALERLALPPDAVAPDLGGIASLAPRAAGLADGRCLYPCSSASPAAARVHALAVHGIELVPAVFYDTVETCPGPLPDGPFARVFFTSPSTVRSYFGHYPSERTAPRRWLAIGPSTLAALRAEGLKGEPVDEPH